MTHSSFKLVFYQPSNKLLILGPDSQEHKLGDMSVPKTIMVTLIGESGVVCPLPEGRGWVWETSVGELVPVFKKKQNTVTKERRMDDYGQQQQKNITILLKSSTVIILL